MRNNEMFDQLLPCKCGKTALSTYQTPVNMATRLYCKSCDQGVEAATPFRLIQAWNELNKVEAKLPERSSDDIDAMVSRFLSWPLPATVRPDRCVMDPSFPHRVGTMLLTAEEARAMLEHVLDRKA